MNKFHSRTCRRYVEDIVLPQIPKTDNNNIEHYNIIILKKTVGGFASSARHKTLIELELESPVSLFSYRDHFA